MIFELDQGYVELALAVDQPAVAARILGAVERARQELARPRTPVESRQQEPVTTLICKQLGDAAFTAAWAEGKAMSLDDATAYALDTLSPATVGATVRAPRPELRVFALGPLRIYRGDRLLTSADWTYTKARELILYLLHRPNATREQIGLEFWPDASAEQVRKRLSAALAHARNALGREHEWITLTDSHYCLDPARAYWFDVQIFEARLQAAKRLLQHGGGRQQAIPLLDEAISLYQGDFAEEFREGEWHRPRREALRQAYLEALLTVGELQAEGERYDQAIIAYQRALAKDPYLEEAHHELIRCYARLNKRSLALRQYDSLTAALAELDATPSPATQALIEHLRRGESL
jgi:DNA-binding SARP family transcriptional activator